MAGSRIVYVLRDYPHLSQTFVRNEVLELRSRGHEVDVLALRDLPQEHVPRDWGGPRTVLERRSRARGLVDSAVVAARHPRRFAAMWREARSLGGALRWTAAYMLPSHVRAMRGGPVRACHTHFAFENAYPTLYLARLLGVPASITVHAADIYRDPAAAVRLLEHFDTVVTVCGYNVDLLRSHGLTRPRLEVVPCGVAVPDRPSDPDGAPASPTVVSVGRFVPKKGFDVLIRAWVSVHEQVPAARLELVGDGPERDAVEQLTADLGLSGTVTFRGARPHDEVLDRIAAASVFVLACAIPPDGDSDALPVVIREAMARGRPVVSTDVAGVPEAIGDAGWVTTPHDPAALASALVEALADPGEAERRGRAARERVAASATLAIAARDLERALEL